jgi:hypothetical protein
MITKTLGGIALKKLLKESQKSTKYEPVEELSFLIDLKQNSVIAIVTGIRDGQRKKITTPPQEMNFTYSSMSDIFFAELEKIIPENSEKIALEMKIFDLEKKLALIIYYITQDGEKKKLEQITNY